MDFFASQDAARRKTKWLLGYFLLAIVGITIAIYGLILVAAGAAEGQLNENRGSRARAKAAGEFTLWRPYLFLQTALGTLAVIGLGSGYKTMQLSGGGGVVARDLGGRLLDRGTKNPDERKLLNIVEEMAIASGLPVPDVYVLENEEGINAFAAGKMPGDAVVGVTRACMTRLNRDELQGVIAHEFSHILNGDMRLNMRLIGLLHGILIIAIIGRVVIELSGNSSRSSEKKGNGLIFVGIGLLIIGYVGVFFARLIQAGISRQREYLADASAVQFTRNPLGISGALQKIGGSISGSKLKSSMADECSHLMFAECLSGLFATHPPLPDRIRRVNPQWDGNFTEDRMADIGAGRDDEDQPARTLPAVPGAMPGLLAILGGLPPAPPRSAGQAVARIGQMGGDDLDHARQLRESVPLDWRELLRDSSGAQAMIFALVLSQDNDLRTSEISMLQQAVDADTLKITLDLQPQVAAMHSSQSITLIDIAIPALRRLSSAEYQRFRHILDKLMASDNNIDLFEFMLQKCLRRHMDVYYNLAAPSRVEFNHLSQIADDAHFVLCHLAEIGNRDAQAIQSAYQAGAAHFQEAGLTLPPWSQKRDIALLNRALDRLDRAAPLVKKHFLHACGRTALADDAVTNEESEMLRAVADSIGCPIPPFVAQGGA